ncbi:MAG: hypothetical protein KTR31_41490 [Myxococcales bacterium]|nr:hypothetical protein [Myxococcales bacterium]
MRVMWMVGLLGSLLAGCEGGACELANDRLGCPECADGVVTCSFEGVSATELSCGGCQARVGLYQALCDQGSTASREEIEAGLVCEPVAKTR